MLARYGFNAIKLPFLHQHVLFDEELPASSRSRHPFKKRCRKLHVRSDSWKMIYRFLLWRS